MAKVVGKLADTAAPAAEEPRVVAQPPVGKVAPVEAMRKFKCGDTGALSHGGKSYNAVNGMIDLPANEAWYTPLIEAGVLVEVEGK
jgi:hypothetical protein